MVTLGTKEDEQLIDSLHGVSYKNFMLHYNFPGFCVGEARPPRSPGRREIGHGHLAERGLSHLLQLKKSFIHHSSSLCSTRIQWLFLNGNGLLWFPRNDGWHSSQGSSCRYRHGADL